MQSKQVFFVTFFMGLCVVVRPQQHLNLDFERLSVEHPVRPWGWNKTNYASVTTQLDSGVTYNGRFSLKLVGDSISTPDTPQIIRHGLEPHVLKSKTIVVSGRVKARSLKGFAWFSISDGFENEVTSEKLSGSTDWQPVAVAFKVTDTSRLVNLNLYHAGEGTSWFDDFKLSVEGKEYTSLPVASGFNKNQLSYLRKMSTPITSFEPLTEEDLQDFKDLTPFKDLVGSAKIIALGESTHGTSEFFKLKHRILQYAVQALGVRLFALEANMVTTEKINTYVKTGEGTALGSMAGIFMVWYTEEVRDLIEWVRAYNTIHPKDQIEFVGFDVQELKPPLDSLYGFLKQRSLPLYYSSKKRLSDLEKRGTNPFVISDSTKRNWFKVATTVYNKVKNQSVEWLVNSTTTKEKDEILWGLQYANLVKQYTENVYRGHLSFYRDQAMANNISWSLNRKGRDTKILIWAHDYHISKGKHPNLNYNIYSGLSMGHHLSKVFGNNYKAFALSTYQGNYWAMKSYTNYEQVACPLFPSPEGSLDEALHQITTAHPQSPGMFLNLSEARQIEWLIQPLPMRFANHVNIDYGYWTRYSIPFQFDGIFFIDKTSSAKPL